MPLLVVLVSSFVLCIAVLAICDTWVEITGERHVIRIGQWISLVVILFTLLYLVLLWRDGGLHLRVAGLG